jgi:hypothetical protein
MLNPLGFPLPSAASANNTSLLCSNNNNNFSSTEEEERIPKDSEKIPLSPALVCPLAPQVPSFLYLLLFVLFVFCF